MRPWSVRVHGPRGICGAGVLLDPHHVLTCAHVVNTALGRPPDAPELPASPIELDFPFSADGHRLSAWVADGGWFPIQGDERGDVAVLALAAPAPDGAAPAVFRERAERGTPVHAYGYPPGVDTGVWAVSYEVGDPGGPEWIQLDATRPTGRRIEHGFSGAAVERLGDGRVVGIVVTEDPTDTAKVAWMLPTSVLSSRWRLPHVERSPHVPAHDRSRGGPPGPAARPACLADAAPEVAGVLRIMRQVADDLPYPLRGGHGRLPLSGVYVRQSVTAASESRRPWDEGIEDMAEEERRPASGPSQPFEQVFERHDHLVIEGAAGLGKSTLGRVLTRHMAERVLDSQDIPADGDPAHMAGRVLDSQNAPADGDPALVPIMLPARVLAGHLDRSWPEALQAAVTAEYGRPDGEVPAGVFSRPLHGRRWLIVVDALDEIPHQDDRERLLTALAARLPDGDGPARYLITTRPLSPGEIDRLRGPRVGFYALQPFDDEALRAFAHNWFDPGNIPSGDAAAEEFLRQVRLAGLEEILEVPLLATVAAHVHQSRRDRPLPAGRYELYEEYMAQFARARSGTAATTLAPLGDLPGGPALATWLSEHQADLMEELATAYTTSERALIEVARRFLAEHAPMPARLPLDWDDVLAEWLCRSGILGRSGTRLRFLHQTFAEHLAATARAKALPDTFAPDEPPWDELVRDMLLEDENARRVLLHHLHLRGPGAALLDWLQQGTLDQRACAETLIQEGTPTSESQLDVHLTRVERQVRAGRPAELKNLAGLTRHAMVRRRLEALLTETTALSAYETITLVDLLRERSDHVRREGPSLLRTLATSDGSVHLPLEAAVVLARFGGEHRAEGAHVLYAIGVDPSCDILVREHAGEALARLGPENRTRAGDAFHRLAADPAVWFWTRLRSAERLAALGGEHRTRAAEILRAMAANTEAPGWARHPPAKELAKLGGRHRAEALDLLRRLADEPDVDAYERGEALVAMAEIEPLHRSEAADALTRLATDLTVDAWTRFRAARELADLGAESRAKAARIFFDQARDPDTDPGSRQSSAVELSNLGTQFHAWAREALRLVGTDLTISPDEARTAATRLPLLRAEGHAHAAEILLRLAAASSVPVYERFRAATTLAKLGGEYTDRVHGLVVGLLDDPLAPSFARVLAAAIWAALRPHDTPVTAALVHQLAMAPTTPPEARILGARALLGMEDRGLGRAAEVLGVVASDHLAGARERERAADELLSLGDENRDRAAVHYGEIATDPTTDGGDRVNSARAAALVGSGRIHGTEILYGFVLDPTVEPRIRMIAVGYLVMGGREHHQRVISTLYGLISDPAAPVELRVSAARRLTDFGPEHRERALKVIYRLAADPGLSDEDKLGFLTAVDLMDRERRAEVAVSLRRLTTDPFTPAVTRRSAAVELGKLGGEHTSWATAVLHRLATDPALPPDARRSAAEELATLGEDGRRQAVDVMHGLALDPRSVPEDRGEAAYELAKLSGADRDRGARVLLGIAVDPRVAPGDRCSAAWRLGRLGGGHRDRGAEILDDLARDPAADPDDRLIAARRLVTLGPAAQPRAVDALSRLARDPGAGAFVRRWAAESLAELPSPHTEALAADCLALLAEDGAADAWNRCWAIERLMTLDSAARRRALKAAYDFTREQAPPPSSRAEPLPRDTALAQMVRASMAVADTVAADTVAADTVRGGRLPTEAALGGKVSADTAAGGTAGWCGRDMVEWPGGDGELDLPRVLAVAWLADIGDEHHHRAVDLLTRFSEDRAHSGRDRILAAFSLLGLSHIHRERGARLLRWIADDPRLRAWERRQAADVLTRLGHEHRATAAALLGAIVADASADLWERVEAAQALDVLDPTGRPAAVAALRPVVGEYAVPVEQRLAAVDVLLRLGPEGRCAAIDLLWEIAGEVEDEARRRALLILARMEDGPREEAARRLGALAADAYVAADVRLRAALDLARMGDAWHAGAVKALRRLAADPEVDPVRRALTLDALDKAVHLVHPQDPDNPENNPNGPDTPAGPASYGGAAPAPAGTSRREVAEALLLAARDASVHVPLRREAAHVLANDHDGYRTQAAEILRELAATRSAPPRERRAAVRDLASLGPEHHADATRILQEIAAAPAANRTDTVETVRAGYPKGFAEDREAAGVAETAEVGDGSYERGMALLLLASLDPSYRKAAADAATRILEDPRVPPRELLDVAGELPGLGARYRHHAAMALYALATDSSATTEDRRRAAGAIADLVGGEGRVRGPLWVREHVA
ncbi:hypothetical protein Ssi03_20400 [Sphaerisporangium siamense]|uniref:NACHT domain-containing protein n=1 Tax=Sphaerisporangium siamense TaxID=795645 RepID=A0A7W7DED8_9ACTN|nr:trypsin-like peptidase domain-containing protein [Sphaerisporangium siamense]MBB4705242.1 hypothetical protein [Sphaerisporangium siamense]GII84050.1 hypothetical protein Ssi03_20400 [Sphaerisporangium siamense]